MINVNNDFLSKLVATFRGEANDHLRTMISGLLVLEKTASPDDRIPIIEAIFREAHSLKGAARAVDLTDIEAICQTLESIFAQFKRGELQLCAAGLNVVHYALDVVTTLLNEPDQSHTTAVADAIQQLSLIDTTSSHPTQDLNASPEAQPTDPGGSTAIDSSLVSPPTALPPVGPSPVPSTISPANTAINTSAPTSPLETGDPVSSPSPSVNDFLNKLIATFRLEADEHLKVMVAELLTLENTKTPDEQLPILETIFREAHSLKGAARAVDLTDIEAVCQILEGVFAQLKRREFALSPEGFDAVHQALDTIEVILTEPNEPHATQIAEAVQRLSRLEHQEASNTASSLRSDVHSPSRDISLVAEDNSPANTPIPVDHISPPPQSQEAIPLEASPPSSTVSRTVRSVPSTEQHLPQPRAVIEETVRVSTAKLDSLFLQAEEMLSAKLSINQYTTDLKDTIRLLVEWHKEWSKISPEIRKMQRLIETADNWTQHGPMYKQTAPAIVEFCYWNERQLLSLENRLKSLTKTAEHDQQTVGMLVDNLLENTKQMLMLPFSSLLEIFPKMVRDLSRSLGKDIDIITRGGEVEIDKRILEELKTPLIHLLRNSLDHGIEVPEIRLRQGKPQRGTLCITVSQASGSSVEILIADDGGGIDRGKVKQAAVKKGLISAKAAENLDEKETLALIFQSEVSTSPIVTDISGRGLGMAIVREKIEKLGGHISVETDLHVGTSFRIVLPLTLATFRGVFIETAGQSFVLPTTSIDRVVRVKRSAIKTIENRDTIVLDERPVPVVYLDAILGLPQRKQRHTENDDLILTLILGSADKRIACCVDEIANEQEVLFKSLGTFLSQVPNIAGATVVGSGKVIPILHVPDLLKAAMEGASLRRTITRIDSEEEASTKSILVAEDSVTSRMLLKGILESAGYRVTTAVDGMDAFSLLQKTEYDLVVSDVEMPRMNGFELTSKIRGTEQFAHKPVVLVTGLDSRQDRERGISAGADAYIVKTSFDQSNLLDVVQRLI
ncbi:MAG: Hpt domain-containing protein [Candidatus Binatia bacterium]